MINPFKKFCFRFSLLLITMFELLSLAGYLMPIINYLTLSIILIFVLVLSLFNLKYGLYIMLVELVIGSQGYLFYYELAGNKISLRIIIWLIIMSIWIVKEVKIYLESRKKKDYKKNYLLANSNYKYHWLAIGIIITLAGVRGLISGNEYSNIFFDANNWLYILILFPLYRVFKKEDIRVLWQILASGSAWLVVKTYFLLYALSHNIFNANYELYRWIRETWIGEITMTNSGFWRIFFQSHIFVVLAWFTLLMFLAKAVNEMNKKKIIILTLTFSFLSSIIIIGLSRSFWVGCLAGILVYWVVSIKYFKLNIKKFLIINGLSILGGIISLALIFAIIRFPFPKPIADFSASTLTDRANISSEAAASSRWSLLPELWSSIKESPVTGKGFGATVTYITSDPRLVNSSADGSYTTYAFEWGWLDIWLEFGFYGLIIYLLLLGRLIFNALTKSNNIYLISFAIGLIALIVIHVFTPYLNHPLGLGFLVILSLISDIYLPKKT